MHCRALQKLSTWWNSMRLPSLKQGIDCSVFKVLFNLVSLMSLSLFHAFDKRWMVPLKQKLLDKETLGFIWNRCRFMRASTSNLDGLCLRIYGNWETWLAKGQFWESPFGMNPTNFNPTKRWRKVVWYCICHFGLSCLTDGHVHTGCAACCHWGKKTYCVVEMLIIPNRVLLAIFA